MTPYEASIERQYKLYADNQWGRENLPPWLHQLLMRLPNAVPSREAVEVLAVTGLMVTQADLDWNLELTVRLLLQRGWSVEMSMMMFKNFRLAHPLPQFKPEMYALMSRKQLQDSFGVAFGNVIADVCVDPDSQPVFAALLFGNLDDAITRPCMHAALKMRIDRDLANDGRLPGARLEFSLEGVTRLGVAPGGPMKSIPYAEAVTLYQEATGCTPEFLVSINPREVDYEELARLGEALRQTDGAG